MALVLLDFLVHPDFPEGMVLRLLYYPVTLDFLLLQLVTVLGYLLHLLFLDFRLVKVQLYLYYLEIPLHLGFRLVQVLGFLYFLVHLDYPEIQSVNFLVLLDLQHHPVLLLGMVLDFPCFLGLPEILCFLLGHFLVLLLDPEILVHL
jgi:hypothetical protein